MGRLLTPGLYGANTVSIGDQIDCGSIVVSEGMINAFADLTGDRFEIHMSKDAAAKHGFPDRVAHGLLVLSLIDGLKNEASAQLRARASLGWEWKFHRPVLAGDQLTVIYTISGKEAARTDTQAVLILDFTITNQRGEEVQSGTNRLLAYR